MKNHDEHQRARLLLEERALGMIGDADAEWLAAHVSECTACAEAESEMQGSIAMLRSEAVVAPPFLVSRTKTRVRIRARELQENAERMRMLWLSLGLAIIFSTTTICGGYLFYVSGWAALSGTRAVVSAFAFVWFWLAPAVLLIATAIYGKGEWLRLLQENSLGRGLGND